MLKLFDLFLFWSICALANAQLYLYFLNALNGLMRKDASRSLFQLDSTPVSTRRENTYTKYKPIIGAGPSAYRLPGIPAVQTPDQLITAQRFQPTARKHFRLTQISDRSPTRVSILTKFVTPKTTTQTHMTGIVKRVTPPPITAEMRRVVHKTLVTQKALSAAQFRKYLQVVPRVQYIGPPEVVPTNHKK